MNYSHFHFLIFLMHSTFYAKNPVSDCAKSLDIVRIKHQIYHSFQILNSFKAADGSIHFQPFLNAMKWAQSGDLDVKIKGISHA